MSQTGSSLGRAEFAASTPPAFTVFPALNGGAGALVVSSPHSGRFYPPDFLAASRLSAWDLRRSEDFYVDRLLADAQALGVPLITANYPRAYCDLNRAAWELDPTMYADALPVQANPRSPGVAAGFGTIARVVARDMPIYRAKLALAEAEQRIAAIWVPFHAALAGLIAAEVARGSHDGAGCLLLDCHSMPAAALTGAARDADIVLGDGFGSTASAAVVCYIEQFLQGCGWQVRRNAPYAGGYITRHYGRAGTAVQAVQIEIRRTLYMTEATGTPHDGFIRVQEIMAALLKALAGAWPSLGQTRG